MNISDGTLLKRTGKDIYAAKILKNHSKGCYGIYQDVLLTVKRYKGKNFITAFKIINHKKRHLTKPDELVKAMKKGIIKAGEWLVIDGGLKSSKVLRQGRISAVKVVTRFNSNFVIKRFGKKYRKDDILRDVKPIRRTINAKSYTIYQFKGCIWQGTLGNLFLVRADGYDNYLPLFTTSLDSKPETIKWIKSKNKWIRRFGVVTLRGYKKVQTTDGVFKILDLVMGDNEKDIKKAVSWILREITKKNSDKVAEFLAIWAKADPNRDTRWIIKDGMKKLPKEKQMEILDITGR